MSPTAPLDDYHRISLALTARIREWYAAQVQAVEAWSPKPYPTSKENPNEQRAHP